MLSRLKVYRRFLHTTVGKDQSDIIFDHHLIISDDGPYII